MKKFILLIAVFTLMISCDDNEQKTIPGSTLYEEILPSGRIDTTLIRFIFENEGNSKLTGKVFCSKGSTNSTGEYFKYKLEPLTYYFNQSPELSGKTVVSCQIDTLLSDTFRIQLIFPDYTVTVGASQVTVKDTLVYKAFKHTLPTKL